jgi:hypothetical protein
MNNGAILLLLAAALISGKQDRTTTVTTHGLTDCGTVEGVKPQLEDFRLANPRELSEADRKKLVALAGFMREHNCRARIEGYTDGSQGPKTTKRNAQARANTLKEFLTTQHVRADQLDVEGKGELSSPPGLSNEEKKIARVVL